MNATSSGFESAKVHGNGQSKANEVSHGQRWAGRDYTIGGLPGQASITTDMTL